METLETMFESNLNSKKSFQRNLIQRNNTLENFMVREFDNQTKIIKSILDAEDNSHIKFSLE
jgi:hypothetical protein